PRYCLPCRGATKSLVASSAPELHYDENSLPHYWQNSNRAPDTAHKPRRPDSSRNSRPPTATRPAPTACEPLGVRLPPPALAQLPSVSGRSLPIVPWALR